MPGANALAYFEKSLLTTVKSFITLVSGGNHAHITRVGGSLPLDPECSDPGSVPGLQKRRIRRRRGVRPFSVVAGKEASAGKPH